MLNHINKRVKDQLSIKLPLKELLKLYRNPDTKPTVRNVSIIYVEMAFDHASPEVEHRLRHLFPAPKLICRTLIRDCKTHTFTIVVFAKTVFFPESASLMWKILQERAEVVPDLLSGIAQVRPEHHSILLRMASKVLSNWL